MELDFILLYFLIFIKVITISAIFFYSFDKSHKQSVSINRNTHWDERNGKSYVGVYESRFPLRESQAQVYKAQSTVTTSDYKPR